MTSLVIRWHAPGTYYYVIVICCNFVIVEYLYQISIYRGQNILTFKIIEHSYTAQILPHRTEDKAKLSKQCLVELSIMLTCPNIALSN